MDLRGAGRDAQDRVQRGRSGMDRRQSVHLSRYEEDLCIGVEADADDSARRPQDSRLHQKQSTCHRCAPMNICVLGLWHLGSVTAAGLAALGHRVVGLDFDAARVANLSKGIAPIFEPGLEELIKRGLSSGNLRFSSAANDANDAHVLWVTYDTPVDDDDNADTDFVIAQIEQALVEMHTEALVLVSSQLPVGSV